MKRLCIYTFIFSIIAVTIHAQSDVSTMTGNFNASSSEASIFEIKTPDNLNCDINISANSSDNVKGTYRIWARAKNSEQESRFINLIEVKLEEPGKTDNTIRIKVLAPRSAPWQGTNYSVGAEINVEVPDNFNIDSRSMHGDVTIKGPFKNVDVDCEFGSVWVTDIDGETNIKSSYADIDLERLKGLINIESTYSDIDARDIEITDSYGMFKSSLGRLTFENVRGPIEATTTNDDILANDIVSKNGTILFHTNYGKIKGSNIVGELVAETSHQPIELKQVELISGVCKFENSYAPISVDIAKISDTHLLINNTYNAINLNLPADASAKLILNVDDGGKIHSKGLSIKPLVLEKTRLVGVTGDGLSKIEASVTGIGEINISGE